MRPVRVAMRPVRVAMRPLRVAMRPTRLSRSSRRRSLQVDRLGLRVEHTLETLCRRDTSHNRSIYQRVRRQMLTHILEMSTDELIEMQARAA